MKCFKCGKNFDYDKYYGICPKCGCYNKRETPQEQHQQIQEQYDGGYALGGGYSHEASGYAPGGGFQGAGYGNAPGGGFQGAGYGNAQGGGFQGAGYGNAPGNGYGGPGQPPQPSVTVSEVKSWRNQKGGTGFLIASMAIFILVLVVGTLVAVEYSENRQERMRQELLDFRPEVVVHEPGESFEFQDLQLSVEEAQKVELPEGVELPLGKKLVAVRLLGSSDGEWRTENQLPELYIRTEENVCYRQISYYDYEIYGNILKKEGFESYDLCWEEELDGWAAFLVDQDQSFVTLCLEECQGENSQRIIGIHQVLLEIF